MAAPTLASRFPSSGVQLCLPCCRLLYLQKGEDGNELSRNVSGSLVSLGDVLLLLQAPPLPTPKPLTQGEIHAHLSSECDSPTEQRRLVGVQGVLCCLRQVEEPAERQQLPNFVIGHCNEQETGLSARLVHSCSQALHRSCIPRLCGQRTEINDRQ